MKFDNKSSMLINKLNICVFIKIIPVGSQIRPQVDFDLQNPELDFQPQMSPKTPTMRKKANINETYQERCNNVNKT